MGHFEQDLARMKRDRRQHTPYEDRHRHRLRAAARARQRSRKEWMARMAWMASGSTLVIAGHGFGLVALWSSFAHGGTAPRPRPGITDESAPGPSVVLRSASTAQEGSTSVGTSTTRPLPVPYRLTTSGRPST